MSASAEFMQAQSRVAPENAATGWLLLAIDGLRLALPQREIRLITLVGDLRIPAHNDTPEIGALAREDGTPWPVYALDGTLALDGRDSNSRRHCVFFESGGTVLGLLCDRLWSVANDARLLPEAVPGCLRARRSPITGFARHHDGLVAVTGAADLASYLDFLMESRHDSGE